MKKFTTKNEIDKIIGVPKCQIGKRPLYYYGNGILISYSLKRFKVEGCERIEYGEEGMFAVSLYHFIDVEMLKEYFKLKFFEWDDIGGNSDNVIDEDVTYGKTFAEIHDLGLNKKYVNHYREGENCVLVDGKLAVQNLFIMYGTYTLFFRGKSKKNKIAGFQFTFAE